MTREYWWQFWRRPIRCSCGFCGTPWWACEVHGDVRHQTVSLSDKAQESGLTVIRLETAIERALEELGEPTPEYPAPVANAVEILKEAMPEWSKA